LIAVELIAVELIAVDIDRGNGLRWLLAAAGKTRDPLILDRGV
jgi:hypothetical protein